MSAPLDLAAMAAQAVADAQLAIAAAAVNANANANANVHAAGANPTAATLVAANPAVAGAVNLAPIVIGQAAAIGAAQINAPPPIAANVQNTRTWDTLVEEAVLEPYTFAHKLAQENAGVTWDEAMAPLTRFLNIIMSPGYTPEAGQWSYVDNMNKTFYLTVIDSNWEVIYGYRRCTALQANGGRLAGLRGDRHIIQGAVIPPNMIQWPGAMTTQPELFTNVDAPAPTIADILAIIIADFTSNWVDPVPGGPIVEGWPMIPIHSKIAAIYLKGRGLFDGFLLGNDILALMPDRFPGEKALWEQQLRTGVTRIVAGTNTSVLHNNWTRVDHFQNAAVTEWYYTLLAVTTGPPAVLTTQQPTQLACTTGPPAALQNADTTGPPAALQIAGTTGPPAVLQTAPPHNITDAQAEFYQSMTDRLASTNIAGSRSAARTYEFIELRYLFERCGAPCINGSYTGLGPESIPEFFQELVAVRGDRGNARMFLERYRSDNFPKGLDDYDFIWSTQLIKDLKGLMFSGQDGTVDYVNRFRGLSIFSLAPISESNGANAGIMRQTIMNYEESASSHGPIETAAMAKVAATWNSVPSSRHEAFTWVEHVWAMTAMMFGDACPLNQYLAQLRYFLRRTGWYVTWTAMEWRAFVWSLHVAYRAFMHECTTHPMACLVSKVESREPPSVRLLPAALGVANTPAVGAEGTGGSKRKQVGSTDGGGSTRAPSSAPSGLSSHLLSMIAAARTKTTKALNGRDIFPDSATAERILGPEFRALITPAGRTPCLKHHVFGNCSNSNCQWGHALRSPPPQPLLVAIANRVKARLDEIVQQHPN